MKLNPYIGLRVMAAVLASTLIGLLCNACQTLHPERSQFLDERRFTLHRLELAHNSREAIQKELLDRSLLRRFAHDMGLSPADLASVRVVVGDYNKSLELQQIGSATNAFDKLSRALIWYIRQRVKGHTKEFLVACITNQPQKSALVDTDLQQLGKWRRELPLSWLKAQGSGTTTNKCGDISRWVEYTLVDGDIAEAYLLYFNSDGSFNYDRSEISGDEKFDAKEVDPKYEKLFREVTEEIEAEMKKQGDSKGLGSCHTFWRLKKEKLKQKGILWRSPAELNPDTRYD